MKWKHSKDEGILISSALVCIWMLVTLFFNQQQYYAEKMAMHSVREHQNDVEYLEIKSIRKRCGEFFCFNGNEFVNLFDVVDRLRLSDMSSEIFSSKETDDYVKVVGESRGYMQRSNALEEALVEYNGLRTFPFVRDAYISLRNEMQKDGISLHFVSGYRDFNNQRDIFLKKLGISNTELISTGVYDRELHIVFDKTAPPGYSKHHTGYAVDFGCGDKYLVFEFLETDCYAWMSENNFERVKKYGFIPSYPEDVEYQGPNPEPWEYVWVGTELLK